MDLGTDLLQAEPSSQLFGVGEIASKREIKQINVLKGKSSVFNYTIKARETQLIKPTRVLSTREAFKRNLLEGNTSRSISKLILPPESPQASPERQPVLKNWGPQASQAALKSLHSIQPSVKIYSLKTKAKAHPFGKNNTEGAALESLLN